MYEQLTGLSRRDAMHLLAEGRLDLLAKNAAANGRIMEAYGILRTMGETPRVAWYYANQLHRLAQLDMLAL